MSSMFKLEVSFEYGSAQHFLFATREEAEREMAAISPKLGRHFYGRNEDDEKTHVIASPAGNATVVCSKIVCVRVVDQGSFDDSSESYHRRRVDAQIDYEIRLRKAMKAAGLDAEEPAR
jgi:hypothetical protein